MQREGSKHVPAVGTVAPSMGTRQEIDGISSALFGKTRQAVLAILYTHPDESFYLRQIIRSAGVGQGTVQRELANLVKGEMLCSGCA